MDDRHALRRELRARRRAVPAPVAQRAAVHCAQALVHSDIWRCSAHIALYLPADGEIDTGPVAERARAAGRRLYLPRIAGHCLEFADWEPRLSLRPNRFGIGEPVGPARGLDGIDLVLLPLVGWTARGDRLGMGGGYYDRTLGTLDAARRPLLLGLAYAEQEIDRLAAEPWDVPVDGVVTERGLTACSTRLRGAVRNVFSAPR